MPYSCPKNGGNYITSIVVDIAGAQGGSPGTGAYGGRVQATVPVTALTVINVFVGSAGTVNTAGYNGGGPVFAGSTGAFGGGGASDIRIGGTALANIVVVAGGGGGTGASGCCSGPAAGVGGGLTGGSGVVCSTSWPATNGFGGSQVAGGAGSSTTSWCGGSGTNGTNGALGLGGTGGTTQCCTVTSIAGGGGGGGGYYGGGGSSFGGAGGGSSFTAASVTAVTHTQGYQAGNGYVKITW